MNEKALDENQKGEVLTLSDDAHLNEKTNPLEGIIEQKKEREKLEKQKLKELKREKKERGMSRLRADYMEKYNIKPETKQSRKITKKVAKGKGDYISAEQKLKAEQKKLKRGKRKKIEKLSSDESNKDAGAISVALISKREEKEKVSPFKKLLNILSYGFVCLFAVILGFLSGNMYIQAAFSNDYNYDEAEYRYTEAELNNIIASNTDVSKVNALYAILIAEEKLKTIDYYECKSPSGSSFTQPDIAPKQIIESYRKKDGNSYEYITVSNGIMAIGEKIVTSDMQNFDIYRTKKLNADNTPVLSSTPTYKLDYDAVRAQYGTDPTNPIAYVISNKTIHSSYAENPELTGRGTPNGGGTYTFTLKLNTDQSVMNYVKQMKYMSELGNYPIFSSISLEFTLDSEFRFVELVSRESYTVYYFGVPAKCVGELYQTFTY